jgi:hypothetical protein
MPSDFSVALAGSVSSAFSTLSVYPLDTIKTHLNKGVDPEGKPLYSVDDVLTRVVFRDGYTLKGFLALYSGVRAKMLMSMLQKFLYFYIYNFLKTKLTGRNKSSSLSISMNLVVGYMAALLAVGVLTPLEVAQTQQQLNPKNKRSITQILSLLYQTEGVVNGFYKGFGTNIILCVNPSIEYTVFDQTKRSILGKSGGRTNLTDAQAFWLGAFAKAVATVVTFPHVRAKVLQQSGLAKWNGMDSSGVIARLLVTEGFSALFAGMKTQLVKNVIASAIMLSLKERIERTVIKHSAPIKSS